VSATRPSYAFAELRRDLRADIETYLDFAAEYAPDRRTAGKRLSALLTPSVATCLFYRASHWLHRRGWNAAALAVARLNLLVWRASIAPASRIGPGLYIPHPAGVMFDACAGANLRLYSGCAAARDGMTPLHGGELVNAPVLGDDVSLGSKSAVIGAVSIGDGARIGFNAVVERDIAPGSRVFSAHVRTHVAAAGVVDATG
jgi:serine O-acetyltransferase